MRGSTPPDECAICASLDGEWRSPQGIKTRFRIKGEVLEIYRKLELLADDGLIERLAQPTRYGVRRTRGRQQSPRQRPIEIVRYRKRDAARDCIGLDVDTVPATNCEFVPRATAAEELIVPSSIIPA